MQPLSDEVFNAFLGWAALAWLLVVVLIAIAARSRRD